MRITALLFFIMLVLKVQAQTYQKLESTQTMPLYNSAIVILSDDSFDYLYGSYQFFNTDTEKATTPIFRLPDMNYGFHIDGWESYMSPDEELICIVDGNYGILRPNGEIVIPFEYEDYYAVTHKSIILKKGSSWYFYNLNSAETPKEISADELVGYGNYDNEFILFRESSQAYFIDRHLEKTTVHIHEGHYGQEYEVFKINKGRKSGLVNSKGEILLEITYSSISRGYNYWIVTGNEGQAMANEEGDLLTEFKYEHIDAGAYDGHGSTLWYKGSKVGLMDTNGREVTDAIYRSLMLLENDLYYAELSVSEDTVFYGYLDHKGKAVVPLKYTHLSYFVNGLAFASLGGKYGFINEKNQVVIGFKYDYSSNAYFNEDGYASVLLNNKCILIDRKGNFEGEGICD